MPDSSVPSQVQVAGVGSGDLTAEELELRSKGINWFRAGKFFAAAEAFEQVNLIDWSSFAQALHLHDEVFQGADSQLDAKAKLDLAKKAHGILFKLRQNKGKKVADLLAELPGPLQEALAPQTKDLQMELAIVALRGGGAIGSQKMKEQEERAAVEKLLFRVSEDGLKAIELGAKEDSGLSERALQDGVSNLKAEPLENLPQDSEVGS